MSISLSRVQSSAKTRSAAIVDGAVSLALLLGVWFSRATAASTFVTWDEPAWVYRSVEFLLALSRGDLRGTLLVGHPGVVTMWAGALSLAWHRFVTGSVSAAQLAAVGALPGFDVHDQAALRQLAALLPAAKSGIAIVQAAVAVALYLLLVRLLGRRYAVAAALFLATDPYYLALSRVLHMDALASGFMLIAVTSALVYARRGRRRYLAFSAVAGGLATLSKSYGILAAPTVGIVLAATRALRGRRSSVSALPARGWRALLALLQDAALWGAVAAATFVALWPAMWVAPLAPLRAMLGLSLQYATSPGDATTGFFRGLFVDDPGPLFYPVAMLFHTTPLVMVGSLLAVLGLFVPWGRPSPPDSPLPPRAQRRPGVEGGQPSAPPSLPCGGEGRRVSSRLSGFSGDRAAVRACTLAVLAYLLIYLAIITVSRKKYDRYILPALLGADLLAALGWARTLELACGALGLPGLRRALPGALAGLLALLQAGLLLGPLYPAHYLAYYNPWMGGPARAVATIPVGWGEGVESAARYLAARPDAANLTVATWAVAGLAPSFPGRATKLTAETVPDADYVLLYGADAQGQDALARRFYDTQKPELVVELNGIPYAWLYPNPYYEPLAQDLGREAGAGDVVVANLPSAFQRHYQGPLRWSVVDGASEEAVAAQLAGAAAQARRVFYLEFQEEARAPREFIRRELSQGALLLWQKPFAYGTLYCYLRTGSNWGPVAATLPAGVDFGHALRLERYGLAGANVQYRQEVGLALAWQALQPPGEDYHYSLRLVDEEGHRWGQRDGPLEDGGFRRTGSWGQGGTYTCRATVPLQPGIPPGRYWVLLKVYSLKGTTELPIAGSDGRPLGTEYRLGPVHVDSATVPPATEDLAIAHPTDLRLGDQVQLLGYALPEGPLQSGEAAGLTFYWRCLARMDRAYELVLRLEREGATAATARLQPVEGYPTDRWAPGEVLSAPRSLAVPGETASGRYDLYLNLYGGDGRPLAGQDIPVGSLEVQHRERLFTVPPMQHPFPATLGDQIELLGYDLGEEMAKPGAPVHLTLYWRARGPTERPYTVFTHLLDAGGAIRGQTDSVPLRGERPTTGWAAGEIIVDPYEIAVRPDAAPGPHRLEIGAYDPASGQRLPTAQGGQPAGDRLLLPATVTVEAP